MGIEGHLIHLICLNVRTIILIHRRNNEPCLDDEFPMNNLPNPGHVPIKILCLNILNANVVVDMGKLRSLKDM